MLQGYESPVPGAVAAGGGQHSRRWTRAWTTYTEITDNAPTHFTQSSGLSARLDRTFVSLPGWAAYGLIIRSEVQEDPRGAHDKRISDHAPVVMCVQMRGMIPSGQRPIARAVVRDPRFSQVLRRTLELWGFAEWSVADRVELYPLAVRSAARTVRDWRRGEEVGLQSAGVVAAARAVAAQRPRDAAMLLESRLEMARWLRVDGSRVVLLSPGEFAEEVRRRRAADLDTAVQKAGGAGAQRAARLTTLRRLWAPSGKQRQMMSMRAVSE